MPKSKYNEIYRDLKAKIESDHFKYLEFLPVENELIKIYACSRNTLRRAVAILVQEGYLQTMQGKGVRNIFGRMSRKLFKHYIGETFYESPLCTDTQNYFHEIVLFTELTCSENLSKRSGFSKGDELYYIQKLHYIDGKALILKHNYLLRSATGDIDIDIASDSIYKYLEKDRGMNIVNSKRIITVEKADQIDEKYLDLNIEEYNCLPVVSSFTYNSEGIMFEYAVSRYRPDCFSFSDNPVRKNT